MSIFSHEGQNLESALPVRDCLYLPVPGHTIVTSSYRVRTYCIQVTPDETRALEAIADAIGDHRATIVTDQVVERLHARRVAVWLGAHGIPVRTLTIAPGERSKNLSTASALFDQLAESDFARHDVLLAIGGGVVIDTVGWVASAYMRGIPYVNVPTTLLAQVDAAIGGKVGVDHGSAKNLIGAFYEPSAVVSCIEYLSTLGLRQLRAGLAEVIKKAVIASPPLFEFVEQNLLSILNCEPSSLHTLVHAASAIKCALVERDPYEADLRRSLNFGHTVGHAVETATGYGPVLHGEAVAFGMTIATSIAVERDLLDREIAARIIDLLAAAELPVSAADLALSPSADEVLAGLAKIRQIRGGSLRFVLPTGLGSVVIADDVGDEEIRAALLSPVRRALASERPC